VAEKDAEKITVRMANAGQTSAGHHGPGDARELPADEARVLLRDGLAARAGTAAESRMHRPDTAGHYTRLRRPATGNG
jgi:hypothetical protein